MKNRSLAKLALGLILVGAPSLMIAQHGLAGEEAPQEPNRGFVPSSGADVMVFELSGTMNYGVASGIRGYAVGTVSCNVGDKPLNWCDNNGGCGAGTTSHDHPVIAQNMYRLKNGRFDQIGASWLKHGFVSTNTQDSQCGNGSCIGPPLGGNQLGIGCTDPYGASLNGSRPLGRKSEVNPTNGAYPFPPGGGGSSAAVWNQRMAVAESDMAAASNPDALYWVEGHYIAPDDAIANNGLNNASYRRVNVAANFNLSFPAGTVRQKAAIEVWQTIDPLVERVNVDTPVTPIERFHVARKVTNPSAGVWHYEYAIHNMNSDRGADKLTIEFFDGATISNVGFKDVNSHSNEPYDITDWTTSTNSTSVSWEAPFFSPEANMNALRWATMYNFWFDANRPPADIELHTLSLFKAGSPTELTFWPGAIQEPPLFADSFESGDISAWPGKESAKP